MPETTPTATPAVSVVVPVRNEAENVRLLADEIATALGGRWSFELIYVNDGSADATEQVLIELRSERPYLRQIKHAMSCGQSAAVRSGVAAARAPLIATLDGDGQNDPSFIPALLTALEQGNVVIAYPQAEPPAALRKLQSEITGPFDAELSAAGQMVILVHRDDVDGIQALAYQRRLEASGATDPQLRAFAEAWLGAGRETSGA